MKLIGGGLRHKRDRTAATVQVPVAIARLMRSSRLVLAVHVCQPVPDRPVEHRGHPQVSGLDGQGSEHRSLQVVREDDPFLGGEVAEERGRRYLGRSASASRNGGLLFQGVQELAAGLLAAPAGLGADPAVLMVLGMPLALIAAALADGHAGLQ